MRTNKRRPIGIILVLLLIVASIVIFRNFSFIFGELAEAVTGKNESNISEVDRLYIEQRLENDKFIKEKMEREVQERERLEKERLERERLERERQEQERQEELDKSRKLAYLTFDDGPSRVSTPAILNILNDYNIKATFFVVGNMVEKNPDILKMVHDNGHQIGNHTYSHNYDYLYKNSKNFMDDIYKTENLIKDIIGEDFDSRIIRFPGGSFEPYKEPMRRASLEAGYNYIDWNALNGDSEGKKRTKGELLERLKETTGNKSPAVILMHDIDSKDTTVDFLREGIEFLIKAGYEFRILDKDYK